MTKHNHLWSLFLYSKIVLQCIATFITWWQIFLTAFIISLCLSCLSFFMNHPAPDPIPSLSVSSIPNNPTSLLVTWEPTLERRCDVAYYIIHYDITSFDQCTDRKATSGSDVSQSGAFNTTETSLTINGLNEYSSYVVSVAPGFEDNVGANITEVGTTLGDRKIQHTLAQKIYKCSMFFDLYSFSPMSVFRPRHAKRC